MKYKYLLLSFKTAKDKYINNKSDTNLIELKKISKSILEIEKSIALFHNSKPWYEKIQPK